MGPVGTRPGFGRPQSSPRCAAVRTEHAPNGGPAAPARCRPADRLHSCRGRPRPRSIPHRVIGSRAGVHRGHSGKRVRPLEQVLGVLRGRDRPRVSAGQPTALPDHVAELEHRQRERRLFTMGLEHAGCHGIERGTGSHCIRRGCDSQRRGAGDDRRRLRRDQPLQCECARDHHDHIPCRHLPRCRGGRGHIAAPVRRRSCRQRPATACSVRRHGHPPRPVVGCSRRAGAGGTGRTGRCLGRRRAADRHRGCVPLD